ncbi:uncharacterized protein LOC112086118 [Eutrema salsugineum]|uniref:uncharacterized protein LOC112086118 n=1 Tax=Eutrema salsugineum TaxID=72664 RepID=UPI000CED64B4|nr:uncharacterized protein LOC112086118 [Eutrema salsugineum]
MGVPLHYWADVTFKSIGKALGAVEAINLDEGKIQVIIDGFKPLVFETTVEFNGGEETTVYLRYGHLSGLCKTCLSLCHDYHRCPTRIGSEERWSREEFPDEQTKGQGPALFKTAAKYGGNGGKEVVKNNGGSIEGRPYKGRTERKYGEGASRSYRPSSHPPPKEHKKGPVTEEKKDDTPANTETVTQPHLTISVAENQGTSPVQAAQVIKENDGVRSVMMQGTEDGSGMDVTAGSKKTVVRKSLSFEDDDLLSLVSRGKGDTEIEDLGFPDGNADTSVLNKEVKAQGDTYEACDAITEFLQQVNSGIEPGEIQLCLDNSFGNLGEEDGEFIEDSEMEMPMIVEQVKSPVETMVMDKSEVGAQTSVMEKENKQLAAPTNPEPKKKPTKSSLQYIGGGSKKRMVQAMVSPRKKQVTKTTNRKGEGARPAAPKGPSLSQEEQKL